VERNTLGSEKALREILDRWGIRLRAPRPDLPLAGSPERTRFRTVVEDREGKLWVLENPAAPSVALKRRISDTLVFLHRRGLHTVHPYRAGRSGETVERVGDAFWQVVPYVGGIGLPRPGYVHDRWRGEACAEFLLNLRERSPDLPYFDRSRPFSMVAFLRGLGEKLALREPALHRALGPVLTHLADRFAPAHDRMPAAFCHGDLHPLNVIWGEGRILSVIDWEFLGFKPEIYDAANLVGCVGSEEPAALAQGFVLGCLSRLKQAETFDPASWACLPEFVAATRFAWLSDWLRRGDREMVEMEAAYIRLLMDHRQSLADRWTPAR